MIAAAYAPMLAAVRPDFPVEVVPGIGHIGMTLEPVALAAIRNAVVQQPLSAPRPTS